MRKLTMAATIGLLLLFLVPCPVKAGVITDGTGSFSVGIGPNGELFDYSSYIGFSRNADGFDPLAPGSPRDSWGIFGATTGSAWADQASYGSSGVSTTGSIGLNSASLWTTTTNGFSVGQYYSFLNANVLGISTTVTNKSGVAQDTVFQRNIDWDVSPTEFYENSFGPAITGNVIDSSYYGFENPDPAAGYFASCAPGCNNTGDLGGGIKIDLGTLAPGQTVQFYYLYGISQSGENVNGLIGQVNALGAYYNIATQSSEAGAYPALGYNSAIIAVAPVPEPSSLALLGTGLVSLIGFARRRLS